MIVRKVEEKDREIFIKMSRDFYSSEAVLENIDDSYHFIAFDEALKSDLYIECLLLLENEKVVGYSVLNKSFNREAGGMVLWVEELYILPEFQGRGYGGKFFDWLEKNSKPARYRLELEPENERAVALYKKRGYKNLEYIQMIKDV